MSYKIELIEFLENSEKRKNLTNILLENKSQRRICEEYEIKNILDELFLQICNEKPIYQRWKQKIGEKTRILSVPNNHLKQLIDIYLIDFIKSGNLHKKCHGGEKDWSVKKSLETHLPCITAFSFDLKSAFENFSIDYIKNFIYKLIDKSLFEKERQEISRFLSILLSVNYKEKRGLPQGSSMSMKIFNRELYFLDENLSKKAEEKNFNYSRWVDDITITSNQNNKIESFLGSVDLTAKYFPVAEEKIFFQENSIIYLLGHKIINNKILKNSKKERDENKINSLDYNYFFKNNLKNYEIW